MKRAFVYVLAGLCAVCPALTSSAQSMSHEEEVVRNAYAKVTLLTAIQKVSESAVDPSNRTLPDSSIAEKIVRAQPVFDLSDFQVGAISDIAGQTWKQYLSMPAADQSVLQSTVTTFSHGDSGNPTEWYGVKLSWVPVHKYSPDVIRQMGDMDIASIIKAGSPQWSSAPVTYTRYAAFTVDATFDGKSTGPHKAIFFFGRDSNGKEYVAENDLISGTQALWDVLQRTMYPMGLLGSGLRDLSVVATWVRANEMPASSCTAGKHDLCCSKGRCGISVTDLNKDLAAPLPQPKDGGRQ